MSCAWDAEMGGDLPEKKGTSLMAGMGGEVMMRASAVGSGGVGGTSEEIFEKGINVRWVNRWEEDVSVGLQGCRSVREKEGKGRKG